MRSLFLGYNNHTMDEIYLRLSRPEYPQLSDFVRAGPYRRIATISLEEGLYYLGLANTQGQRSHYVRGTIVSFGSTRLATFFHKGTNCVACKRKGIYFAIERMRTTEGYHVNLWGMDKGGHYMMTSDHIVPKAAGGRDVISNRQPMCFQCNVRKGCIDNNKFIKRVRK